MADSTPSSAMPQWAQDMRELFKSGTIAQFVLHGNVFDVVPARTRDGMKLLPLKQFLDEVMFASYDVVITYDRGKGIRPIKGADDFGEWLEQLPEEDKPMLQRAREPARALEIIDRYLLRTLNLRALSKDGKSATNGISKIAVIIDFAEFVVPAGNALQLGGDFATNIVKTLAWANDPAIQQSNIATVLITEQLNDLNDLIVQNPHAAKLKIPLPDENEMIDYLRNLQFTLFPDLSAKCEVPVETLARRLTGLSRIGARTVIGQALNNDRTITAAWLTRMKKETIERETGGLLEFMESPFTLDQLSGADAVKVWLREDAQLLKKGSVTALPMGYLIAGRIGTGKTFLVNCWAGELGVPAWCSRIFGTSGWARRKETSRRSLRFCGRWGRWWCLSMRPTRSPASAIRAGMMAGFPGASTRCSPRKCPTRATAEDPVGVCHVAAGSAGSRFEAARAAGCAYSAVPAAVAGGDA